MAAPNVTPTYAQFANALAAETWRRAYGGWLATDRAGCVHWFSPAQYRGASAVMLAPQLRGLSVTLH